jgi:RNA-directed DNA polymerase
MPVDKTTQQLLRKQNGRCPLCQGYLLHADHQPQAPDEWEQWVRTIRKAITKNYLMTYRVDGISEDKQFRLTHTQCLRRLEPSKAQTTAFLPVHNSNGLA